MSTLFIFALSYAIGTVLGRGIRAFMDDEDWAWAVTGFLAIIIVSTYFLIQG